MRNFITKPTTGIKMISYFALWVLFSEALTIFIGGDIGSFLWTTFHFILNPILGVIVLFVVIWHALKHSIPWLRIVSLASCFIPLLVIYLGYTGDFWLYEMLNVKF